jgi:hypothetical protein
MLDLSEVVGGGWQGRDLIFSVVQEDAESGEDGVAGTCRADEGLDGSCAAPDAWTGTSGQGQSAVGEEDLDNMRHVHALLHRWDRDENMRLGHAELIHIAHNYNALGKEAWQVLVKFDADRDGSLDVVELGRWRKARLAQIANPKPTQASPQGVSVTSTAKSLPAPPAPPNASIGLAGHMVQPGPSGRFETMLGKRSEPMPRMAMTHHDMKRLWERLSFARTKAQRQRQPQVPTRARANARTNSAGAVGEREKEIERKSF